MKQLQGLLDGAPLRFVVCSRKIQLDHHISFLSHHRLHGMNWFLQDNGVISNILPSYETRLVVRNNLR